MKWLIFIALSFSATAQVQTWNNPDCANGGECEVRSMKIKTTYEGAIATMVAEMKTTTPEQLRKYAFVQYIRGCVFEATPAGPGNFLVRDYRGQTGFRFQHQDWHIDSVTSDPIYFSTRNPGFDSLRGFEIPRNANYLVTDPTVGDESRFGGKITNVVDNRLFVFDRPTGGSVTSTSPLKVINSSLEFKICLHEIAEIPRPVLDHTAVIDNPIACLSWDSRHHYNFSTRRFIRSATLHPRCGAQ